MLRSITVSDSKVPFIWNNSKDFPDVTHYITDGKISVAVTVIL